jgi:phosphoribosylanthranilate isomerase
VTPRLKICCISSIEEAALALEHGASALGLVSEMPSGTGVIPDGLIAEIADWAPPAISTVLLTCRTAADDIIGQHERCRTSTIQLVDAVAPGTYEILRSRLPGIKLIQVIHVTGPEALVAAQRVEDRVDAILLDSGNPNLVVKKLGGTGRVHDWSLSRQIVASCARPVFLAGGLDATNVRNAFDMVRPFGLDLCNGVRTNNQLDPAKLEAYMSAVSDIAQSEGPLTRP